jgi:type IV pilus assembly protein PilA
MRNFKMQGFTLIELMIVVAIIAILAAIALPAYQDYLIRSQVSEGAVLADGAKTAVSEFYSNRGTFPPTNISAGLSPAASIQGKYVKQVDAAGGIIKATYSAAAPQEANAKIDAKTLGFSPVDNLGSLTWNCRTGGAGGTDVDPKYLPSACR